MLTFDSHAIFAGMAALFCFVLGTVSLLNGRSPANRLFAAYNFANGLWNSGDLLYVFDGGTGAFERMLRLTGLGGCFLAPFYIHFCFHVAGIAARTVQRNLIRAYYAAGALFAVLHQTPLLHTSALTGYKDAHGFWSTPGPIFPVFIASVLLAPALVLGPLPGLLKRTQGLRHNQITYLITASVLGFVAVGIFAASFFSYDLPWAYYSVQCFVSFVFAYMIFQHHLIQLNLALRRVALLGALYSLVALVAVPVAVKLHALLLQNPAVDLGTWAAVLVVFGGLLSLPPVLYSAMVRRSSVFQDRASWQITHELKTPLSAIQSALDMLQAEMSRGPAASPKAGDYTQIIERNSARLERLVEQLLTFGKADHEGVQERQVVNLRAIGTEVAAQFPADRYRVDFLGDADIAVAGFAEGLGQILTNLISNAVTHAPGSRIVIAAERKGENVHVSVADAGKGIPKADLARIFQPFTRSSAGRTGSGLGLSIAKRWVEAHGGRIWAESEGEGKGTTVRFTLPAGEG